MKINYIINALWYVAGGLSTSILIRIDRPECFAPDSIVFPGILLALTGIVLVILSRLFKESSQ